MLIRSDQSSSLPPHPPQKKQKTTTKKQQQQQKQGMRTKHNITNWGTVFWEYVPLRWSGSGSMIQHLSDYLSVKGTAKSHLDQEDLFVPFMHNDPSDPRMEVGQKCVPQLFTFITIFILLYYIILYYIYFFIHLFFQLVIFLFIFFQLPNSLICLNRFSLLAHLVFYITFVSNFQLLLVVYNIWIVTTYRFFIKSPEEGRLVRPKYRETSSRFSLCRFVIYANFSPVHCNSPGKLCQN